MNLFLHLVRRELRDVRWHVRGGLVATTALVLLTYWTLERLRGGPAADARGDVARFWFAASAILGGGAVAAEVFAGDASSRRIDGAALAPVGLGRVFAAKAAVVLGATAAFGAWAVVCAPAAALAFTSDASALGAADAVRHAPAILACIPFVVGTIALVGVVLEHGLGAIVGGAAAAFGLAVGIGTAAPIRDWGLDTQTGGVLAVTAAVVAAGIVWTAAGLAFVHGPIHLGRRVRRAAIGLGTAVAALSATGGAAAAVLEARTEIRPGDPEALVTNLVASPDGRYAVAMVGAWRVPAICRAWLVDVETGRVTVLPGRHRIFHEWGTWESGPTLRLWGSDEANRADLVDTFDAATGRLLRSRSLDQDASEPRTEGWARLQRTPDGFLVEWPARGIRQRVAGANWVRASPQEGRVFVSRPSREGSVLDLASGRETALPWKPVGPRWPGDGRHLLGWTDDGSLREFDAETGATREVPAPSGRWIRPGAGRYGVYGPDARHVAVADTRTGRVVAGPWPAFGDGSRTPIPVRGSDRWMTVHGSGPTTLLDCDTGREVPLDPDPNRHGFPSNLVAPLPGDRFLVAAGAGALTLVDAAGHRVREIPLESP